MVGLTEGGGVAGASGFSIVGTTLSTFPLVAVYKQINIYIFIHGYIYILRPAGSTISVGKLTLSFKGVAILY